MKISKKMINLSFLKLNSFMLFLLSLMFCFSSNSLFFIWISMEINMLTYISMMKPKNSKNYNNLMMYYIIQSLASSLFIFFFILSYFNNFLSNYSYIFFIIFLSMWMKMGFFPFSAWYFQMSENLNWFMWFMLNTLQKIMPLWILTFFLTKTKLLNLMILLNVLYSLFEIWNQVSIRWMINASSLNHFSWMILSLNSKFNIWEMYFIFYLLSSAILYAMLWHMNWNSMLNTNNNTNYNNLVYFSLILFNFMGLPPFLGFLPKLMVMMTVTSWFLMILLILLTIFTSIIYIFYTAPLMNNFLTEKMLILKNTKLMKMNFYFIMVMLYLLCMMI
uniref:NADH-ubiquinone oxidoreductase chain 2 n=1 Tax=Amblyseius hainanensis TaxID=3061184 RepID=A0AAU6PBL7_9ACAR